MLQLHKAGAVFGTQCNCHLKFNGAFSTSFMLHQINHFHNFEE